MSAIIVSYCMGSARFIGHAKWSLFPSALRPLLTYPSISNEQRTGHLERSAFVGVGMEILRHTQRALWKIFNVFAFFDYNIDLGNADAHPHKFVFVYDVISERRGVFAHRDYVHCVWSVAAVRHALFVGDFVCFPATECLRSSVGRFYVHSFFAVVFRFMSVLFIQCKQRKENIFTKYRQILMLACRLRSLCTIRFPCPEIESARFTRFFFVSLFLCGNIRGQCVQFIC